MASTQSISEAYGAAGVTEQNPVTNCNYMRTAGPDLTGNDYKASPINSTNNELSYSKVQMLKFAGTWNSLSALTVKIDNNNPATGLNFTGSIQSAGSTPVLTDDGDPAMSTTGLTANFVGASFGYGAGTASSTASGTMYSQALRTQLKTASTYAGGPGDIAQRLFTWSWTES